MLIVIIIIIIIINIIIVINTINNIVVLLASESRRKDSDIWILLRVKERMRSDECFQHWLATGRASGQKNV